MLVPVALRPLLLVALAIAGAGQGPTPAGTWSVRWDSGIRRIDDERVEVQRRSTGTLRLQLAGDSVTGAWISGMDTPHGRDTSGVRLAGSWRHGTLSLRSTTAGALGEQVTFSGVLQAGRLRGSMRVLLGNGDAPERHWEAEPAR